METKITLLEPWKKELLALPKEILDPKDIERVTFTFKSLVSGDDWSTIASNGLSRPEYVLLKHASRDFKSIANEVEKLADETRQLEREDVAHHRAVVGEVVPIINQKGEQVGEYKKASDRLMETLLRASNPQKYTEKRNQQQLPVTLSLSFGIPSRVNQEEKDAKEVIEIEAIESN